MSIEREKQVAAEAAAELVEIYFIDGLPVVADISGLRTVKADEELHQRRLARS